MAIKLARQAARSAVLCRVLGPESSLLKILAMFPLFQSSCTSSLFQSAELAILTRKVTEQTG
jgi:hypothetical protein